jgi:Arc/MetJ-type ribon-helix-helix transcriptional regulator
MVMETMQIRMNGQLVREVDKIVKSGFYANRADVIRDAVRRFVWEREVGSIKDNGKNSVEEIRKIRERFDKGKVDLDEINRL